MKKKFFLDTVLLNNGEYHIKLTNGDNIIFSNNKLGNIFICGFTEGLFGEYDEVFKCYGCGDAVAEYNMQFLLDTYKSKHEVWYLGNEDTLKYHNNVIRDWCNDGILDKNIAKKYFRGISIGNHNDNSSYEKEYEVSFNNAYNYAVMKNMKFDTIIQNPPYNKSLHLDFLEKGLDLLSENGKMVIIEPSTWLINIRRNGKAKKYDAIKQRLEGHIESIVIENLNKEFNTGLYVPFATTTIDMSKTFDTIDCNVCGEHKVVSSIYDCNLIGKYETIWSILTKVQKFGDMMNNHITKEDKGRDYWYAKYHELTTRGGLGITACVNGAGMILENAFNNDTYYNKGYNNDFYHSGFSTLENEISNEPLHSIQRGGAIGSHKTTDKIADNIYGTKAELENWKHFIFNNKLPLFINIVMTIDQHNNSKEFLPWLVDKHYIDEEINDMFGFTVEEIKLIDTTIKKYERNSPWFKRYMCGKDSVSDEEVNNFIKEINM